MDEISKISKEEVNRLYEKLKSEAKSAGYNLNPDLDSTKGLVEALLINESRYGYWACPCRLAAGKKEEDLDIICPCDYRDTDLEEYGACYCSLYISQDAVDGKVQIKPVPERRPGPGERKKSGADTAVLESSKLPFPVFRCKVCGYLCAREQPPGVCPVCKVKKDRFERFI
jgi:ferredoxin-thioredoxin reductase catalytic subunit